MKEKILLIAGCSHAAGSEIDGQPDSIHNRQHSFGNQLAVKMGRKAINIASTGASNQAIARTIIEWLDECYDANTMDLFVLVSWTESCRIDFPMNRPTHHEHWNPASEYVSSSARDYIRINMAYKGADDEERYKIATCQTFMAFTPVFFEILTANLILQIQYFLNSKSIDYLMCNTMYLLSESHHFNFYIDKIDQNKYLNLLNNDESFYWKYRNAGFLNPNAKYWHHGEEPHALFAEELYNFYLTRNL